MDLELELPAVACLPRPQASGTRRLRSAGRSVRRLALATGTSSRQELGRVRTHPQHWHHGGAPPLGNALFETDRHKLVVWEDSLEPVALFDLAEDPLEDHQLIDDPAYASTIEELMELHVRPFLKIAPARPHRSAFDRR